MTDRTKSKDPEPLLEIDGLSVDIAGLKAVDGIDLRLAPGRILGLVGESGSGKSMTALATMGLLPRGARAGGAIRLNGENLLEKTEAQLCRLRGAAMGMVFQEPMTALNPLQTIGRQVAETIFIHGRAGRREAMDLAVETLNRVGLPPDRFPPSRYPHELSGGQRQRVVIAMAVALKPRLIIADEPTTALDVTTQARILDLLKALVREDGASLLMITHDLAVIANLADDLAIMRHGRIVEQGATDALLGNLRHPYSRQLLEATDHRPAAPPPVDPGAASLLALEGVVRDYPGRRRGLGFRWRLTADDGRTRAVDGVGFTIAPGETVGLVGESGCGKSTLARTVLGLEAPQQGSIRLAGEDFYAAPPARLATLRQRVQIVFQDPYGSFNPRHRVDRLVAEPFHLVRPIPSAVEKERRVSEALEAVGLAAADGRRFPHEFSGGQRQRIAIARALVTRPELIVLDEAVSALDVSIRAQILDLLAALRESHRLAYLFISHDLAVIRAIASRVLVMQNGRIVEEGPTERVFQSPAATYTRTLLAASPSLPNRRR